MMQIAEPDLIDMALTITHFLESKNVSTYSAEKILSSLLTAVMLYQFESGRRGKWEILDLIDQQKSILTKEIEFLENGR